MDVRRLDLLRELAERGTVHAVAEATHRTPSAVSQQLKVLEREAGLPLHLVRAEPFVGLPYLATFGFKVERPLPGFVQSLAGAAEAALRPLARWLATRIFIVLEKPV